mgnify:FL=1
MIIVEPTTADHVHAILDMKKKRDELVNKVKASKQKTKVRQHCTFVQYYSFYFILMFVLYCCLVLQIQKFQSVFSTNLVA